VKIYSIMSWWSTDFQSCHLFALMLLINSDIFIYNANVLMLLCLLLANLLLSSLHDADLHKTN
jgi:hypothetical protein